MSAPSFTVHLTESSATRMDPCPVFAYVGGGRQSFPLSSNYSPNNHGTTWTAEANNEYSLDQTLESYSLQQSGTARNIYVRTGAEFVAAPDLFFAEGTVGALSQGEWGRSGGKLYVRMPDDSNPADGGIYALTGYWDTSDPGDGKDYSYSFIEWQVILANGATWPTQFRYITDPRTGEQIDLSGTTDTANANRPNGMNMGWVLPAGTHTIRCKWTNANGETTTVDTQVTIAADTRTEYVVNSEDPGADYSSISQALSERSATNNTRLTVEGGHAENIGTGGWFDAITASNFVVAWDGLGARPAFTYNGSPAGSGGAVWGTSGEHTVFYGLDFYVGTGGVLLDPNTQNIRLASSNGTNAAFVSMYADRVNKGFNNNNSGLLLQSNTIDETTFSYSFISDGNTGGQYNGVLLGNDFGPSYDESVVRLSSDENYINLCWNTITESLGKTLKSTLRLANGGYYNGYGNKLVNGKAFFGRVNPQEAKGCSSVRFEANLCGQSEWIRFLDDALGVVAVNNVVDDQTADSDQFVTGADGFQKRCLAAHNTAVRCRQYVGWGGADDNGINEGNRIAANLCKLNTAAPRGRGVQFSLTDTYVNNVYDDDSSFTDVFAREFENGSVVDEMSDTAALNAKAWASGNQLASFTLDSEYLPSTDLSVTTEDGVIYDYYGVERDAISYAGAVASAPSDGDSSTSSSQSSSSSSSSSTSPDSSSSISTSAGPDTETGLLYRWRLDNDLTEEVAGNSLTEVSGTITFSNSALPFSGTATTHNAVLDSGDAAQSASRCLGITAEFTYAAWIKTTSGNFNPLAHADVTSENNGVSARVVDGVGLRVQTFDSSYNLSGSTVVNDGSWHHVAWTFDGTDSSGLRLYVDGVLDAEGDGAVSINNADGTFSIGGGKAVELDDIRIYNVALTPDDIGTLYGLTDDPEEESSSSYSSASSSSSSSSTSTSSSSSMSSQSSQSSSSESEPIDTTMARTGLPRHGI